MNIIKYSVDICWTLFSTFGIISSSSRVDNFFISFFRTNSTIPIPLFNPTFYKCSYIYIYILFNIYTYIYIYTFYIIRFCDFCIKNALYCKFRNLLPWYLNKSTPKNFFRWAFFYVCCILVSSNSWPLAYMMKVLSGPRDDRMVRFLKITDYPWTA